jgi:predicted nucleotidyltransferase
MKNTTKLKIKVPTLPGLALMKIISWKDKYPERRKDAEDLLFVMQNYEEADNYDRLYDHEQDLLKEENFEVQPACIRLLGRDMAMMADPDTLGTVRAILDEETAEHSRYRLVTDMVRSTPDSNDRFEKVVLQVAKLRQGFNEVHLPQAI